MIVKALISALLALTLWGGGLPAEAMRQRPAVQDTLRQVPAESFPVVGISTNLPYDLTWVPGYGVTSVPSFSVEYFPARWERWTVGADVEWPMWKHWKTHRFLQVNNLTLWARRYFRTRATRAQRPEGLYLLGNVNAARYGIGFDMKGWEGEGLGASVGVGYKRGIGKGRFYWDAGIALGAFLARQDPYVWGNDANGWYYYDYTGDPATFKERNQRFFWAGPTRIYFSVGMDLFRRKKN